MPLPSNAQLVSAAKGHGDTYQTLLLLRNQTQAHVEQIAALQAQLAALNKK